MHKWSDIVVVRLSEFELSSIIFEKKLSINVWDLGVTHKSEVMYGHKKFVYILSRNYSESLLVSYFKISILKSPINIMFLFSKESFSIRFCKKVSLKSLGSIQGCLYMHHMIVFLLLLLFITSIKADSSSLLL